MTRTRTLRSLLSAAAALLILAACTAPSVDLTTAGAGNAFAFRTDPAADYLRVDRMGMPAIGTAVISSKDAYNQADPSDDAAGTFVAEIVANVTGLHDALDDDLTGLGLTPCAPADCVAQATPLVVPDVLRLDTSQPNGFPNGRRLADPVIDVTLAVVLLDLGVHPADLFAGLPLNPPANDLPFLLEQPYVAAPHAP